MKITFLAAIHVLSEGEDFSKGAVMWDGIDQAAMGQNTPARINGFENHSKTMGWNIADDHYNKWKNSIDNSKWAKNQLNSWFFAHFE